MTNYIKRLQAERDAKAEQLQEAIDQLDELLGYLQSAKFHLEDYVHVRTDLFPKLQRIKSTLNN